MKKQTLLGLLGLLFCSAATPAAADCYQNWNNNCCEWTMYDGKINAGADWLYWKTEQDNMLSGSVVTGNFNNSDKNALIFEGKNKRPNYKYDSGFRVWAGYELPCDCWEVGVSYTYVPTSSGAVSFHSDIVQNAEAPAQEYFTTYFSDFSFLRNLQGQNNGGLFTDFHSKWSSNLNYIDLDVARTVCLGECFKLRPHVGFRSAWSDQKLLAVGSFPVEVENQELPNIQVLSTRLKQKFRGYGIEGGVWGEWNIGCGFSLVGHVGGSVLYSKFSTTQTQALVTFAPESNEGDLNFAVDVRDSYWTGTPTADYFLGVKYENCFCDMTYNVHAGWEQHIFFDMNRLSSNGGNLSMQGLTLGLDVGF